MATPSNTSHSNNLASYNSLIKAIKEFGKTYNPPKPILTVVSMESQYETGAEVISRIQAAEASCRDVMVLRSNLFGNLDSFAQRVVGLYSITCSDPKSAESIKMILRNMRGRSVAKKAVAAAAVDENVRTRSNSQLGFEDKSSNFAQIASFVESSTTYVANEADLSKEAIRKYSDDLKLANNNLQVAEAALETARIDRDRILYTNEDSLYNVFREVKTYVKSAYGSSSAEFKRISGLEFRNYSK